MVKKYITCFLSVLLLSVSFISYSAFADNTYSENVEGYLSYIHNKYGYYDSNYIVYSYIDGVTRYGCILFPSSVSEVEFTDDTCKQNCVFTSNGAYYNTDSFGGESFAYSNNYYTSWDYLSSKTILSASVNITYNGNEVYTVPSDVPFTVSVSPELFEGMSPNTITYPSKQGSNGQSVTDTNYNLNFSVTLSDDFIEHFGSSNLADYGYSYTVFVVPSQYVSNNIDTISQHSIYNYTYFGYFTNDVCEVQQSLNIGMTPVTDGTKHGSQTWRVGEGETNVRSVSCTYPTDNFCICGDNINFASNPAESYKFVIHAYYMRVDKRLSGIPSTYYFMNNVSHSFEEKDTLNLENGDSYEYYKQYTWVSDAFSYAVTPVYVPSSYEQILNENGETSETNPFIFSRTPSRVWDDESLYSFDSNGNLNGTNSKGYTPSEWNDVVKQRQYSEAFADDLGFGSFGDLFNGESNFFHFLTASIAILPSWFLTILSTFFVTLLTIVILKLLL